MPPTVAIARSSSATARGDRGTGRGHTSVRVVNPGDAGSATVTTGNDALVVREQDEARASKIVSSSSMSQSGGFASSASVSRIWTPPAPFPLTRGGARVERPLAPLLRLIFTG